jgi:hypothetical protein
MRRSERDPAFLRMAFLAAVGGVGAISCAIAIPVYRKLHGLPYSPEFFMFSAWGFAALGGAYACVRTYFLSGPPPRRPPRGGVPLRVVGGTVPAVSHTFVDEGERKAA